MITPDSPFMAPARISRAAFADIIRKDAAAGVAAERDPGAYWDAIAATGVDPLLVLAIFRHESTFGKAGAAETTFSWGNTRPPTFGAPEIGRLPQYINGKLNGYFSKYRDWLDGAKSTAARLATPEYVYSGKSTHPKTGQVFGPRHSIREIFDHPSTLVWAPAGDFNNPASYLRDVIDYMNQVSDQEGNVGSVPKPEMRTDIRSEKYGGYAEPRIVQAAVEHISNGRKPGDLVQLTKVVSSNYYIDREGTIYELVPPDMSPWTNGQVRKPDLSNPLIASWVAGRINPNTRTVTIEHEGMTSDGAGGALTSAQWGASVHLNAWLAQEYGYPVDRTHLIGHYQIDSVERPYCPGFSDDEWQRLVADVAAFSAPPTDTALYLTYPDGTRCPHPIVLGFRAWCEAQGKARGVADLNAAILSVTGYPSEPEWLGKDGRTYQRFERIAALQYNPKNAPPFDVVPLICGTPLPDKAA